MYIYICIYIYMYISCVRVQMTHRVCLIHVSTPLDEFRNVLHHALLRRMKKGVLAAVLAQHRLHFFLVGHVERGLTVLILRVHVGPMLDQHPARGFRALGRRHVQGRLLVLRENTFYSMNRLFRLALR